MIIGIILGTVAGLFLLANMYSVGKLMDWSKRIDRDLDILKQQVNTMLYDGKKKRPVLHDENGKEYRKDA